ncbi:hypothetical protein FS837_004230 [Tulasnella sp. UAMH 9824]|nr:hypothetical protein FS837_004230 [Tulasnella sp. UAMH 9824]
MLVSSSKLPALFVLFASAVAAPRASSRMSNVMESSATELYPTAEAQSEISTTKEAAFPLVTEVTTVTLLNISVSGSDSIITSTFCEKPTLSSQSVTLNPVGFAGVMSRPLPSTIAVPGASRAATATSSTTMKNGAQAQNVGGMGLAAIIGGAGILAAAL